MWTLIKFFLTACFISMATACYLLLATTNGLQYDMQWIAERLPGKLSIKKMEGTIVSGFTLHDFYYESPTITISFGIINVKWNPVLLLKDKWDIHQLTLEQGRIVLSDTNKKSHDRTPALTKWWNKIILRHLSLKNIYVEEGKSKIELNGDITHKWNLKWKIQQLNLHQWSSYDGYLDSIGEITGELGNPRLFANFHVKSFKYQDIKIDDLTAKTNVVLENRRINSTMELQANHIKLKDFYYKKLALTMLGNISIEDQHKIDGAIVFHTFDINQLPLPNGYIKNLHGKLDAQFKVQGTLKDPLVTGKLQLTQGDFLIPKLGIHPNAIRIEAQLLENKTMEIKGAFQLASNKAEITGIIDFNKPNFPVNLNLQGKLLPIIQLSEYKIKANPNLKITLLYPRLQIEGDVFIPYAEIKPKNLNGTTTLPNEVVFVKNQESIDALSLEMMLNVNLHLGDNIQVHYDNLQATLSGNLHITKENDTPVIAQGELYSLQGRYTTYGQKLLIERGRLIYAGNTLTNPGLDITAVKTVRRILTNTSSDFKNTPLYAGTETLKVGVTIHGTADKPVISLFSNPSDLNQADILSYLILGQPQSSTSNAQGAAILTLLTNLNPKSAKITNITEFLQETLGLTELNIESVQSFNPSSKSVEATTSFIIGKQLTKKLSLHYSIGLFDPVSVLNLRYQINDHWALQSETSTVDNGADLLYVFERE